MKYVFLFVLVLSVKVNAELNCEEVSTTIDINYCLNKELEAEEVLLEKYLGKSRERYAGDRQSANSITEAQEAWISYREAHCGSVYDIWRDGTIRGAMSISCLIQLAKQRTHDIWLAYLTFVDSTAPLLPEPKQQ